MEIDFNKFFADKIHREVKSLFLEMIFLLEDYLAEGKINKDQFDRARKRILDRGNNTVRSLHTQIEEFEITLKKKQ